MILLLSPDARIMIRFLPPGVDTRLRCGALNTSQGRSISISMGKSCVKHRRGEKTYGPNCLGYSSDRAHRCLKIPRRRFAAIFCSEALVIA